MYSITSITDVKNGGNEEILGRLTGKKKTECPLEREKARVRGRERDRERDREIEREIERDRER